MTQPVTDDLARLRALLEDRAEAALADVTPAIPRRPDPTRPARLSAAQSRLWFLAQYEQSTAAYHVPVALRLCGALNRDALLRAVREVAERHHVLRSAIRVIDGEPASVLLPADAVPVSTAAFSEEALRAEAARPFALDAEPPMRAVLFRVADDEHVLALTFHHVAFDDWSYDLLLRDLDACYRGAAPEAPALQYADIAAVEPPVDTDEVNWWSERLDGLAPVLSLPADRRRPAVADWAAGQVTVTIPEALAERVRTIASESGGTPFMVLLAAWQALLGRLAGVEDVAVAVPEAGRHRPETEDVIGCLVNTVVARTDLAGDPTGRELLGRVREVVLDAFTHAGVPFDAVVGALRPERTLAGAPLVQALLNVLDTAGAEPELGGLRVSAVETPALTTQFDVRLTLARRGATYEGALVYRSDLFEPETAANWARWYVALLDGMLTALDEPVSAVQIAEPTVLAGPRLDAPATVLDAVIEHARRTPDAVAAQDEHGELSYRELVAWAGARAAAIDGEVVGVCLPRDRHLPAALLAVLWAGAAYLPLEPGQPVEHLSSLAAEAGVKVVVSRGDALATARAIPGVAVLDLDTLPEAAPPALPQDGLAYLLYTSGSTGAPKGVEITHANLAAFVTASAARPGLGADDTVLAHSSLSFDASAFELWAPLATGARCHVVSRDVAVDGHLLAERMRGTTVILAPPTTFRMLRAAGWTGDPQLRVWCGGEAMDAALAADLTGRVKELWNVYGPTEATIVSTVQLVSDVAGETAPIGTPLAGEWAYVMDRHGRPVPPGVVGELWLGGAGVGRGYRGRPDLTEAAFVTDPCRPRLRCYRTGDLVRRRPEGGLEFIGRRDRQVKVRGYRVELGAVEAALLAQPVVEEAAVLVGGRDAGAHLVGYVAPASIDAEALQAALARTLPDHLVPRRWVVLDVFPSLPSGKIDRHALPAPGEAPTRRERVAPATEAELLVADVWEAVLSLAEVDARDDFFGLGGHSLAATRVAGRLTDALGFRIPVRLLFDRPVLADLALEVERLVLDAIAEEAV
ncbi:non-ribosomal peptide synthetase [Solirubrobacter soli]|uniref:non-ribosomal peptide synthetase n=1 Tax=Solirubrobacter soli TaxID=363832 RepID=UPI0004060559|nr:non-ribosomal peptide synthetase [Solirubrobacter soli]